MIKDKYLRQVTDKISEFNNGKNLKFFIFGSSLVKDDFGDLDLGVMGEINEGNIAKLKDELAESSLPYSVDIVNFNKVSQEFKENVLGQKILWLTL